MERDVRTRGVNKKFFSHIAKTDRKRNGYIGIS